MKGRNVKKNEIAQAICVLAVEAEKLKTDISQEKVGEGQTPFTVAVARNHVSTITLKRELASIVRSDNKME